MALGQKSARGVGHIFAAIGVVSVGNEFLCPAFGAEAKALVGDQFVMGEAIVQFDHVHILDADARLFLHLFRGGGGHVVADDLHHVMRLKGRGEIGGHGLRGDRNGGRDVVFFGEGLGAEDRRRPATGRRTGHEPGHHALPHEGGVHYVIFAHLGIEEGKGVVDRVARGLGADLGKVAQFGAVFLHMAFARAAEVAQRQWHLRIADKHIGFMVKIVKRCRAIGPVALKRAALHLLKANGEDAIGNAVLNRLTRKE